MENKNKIGNSVVDWVNKKGGWLTCCILGAFGVIMASSGMIIRLIDIWHTEDRGTFFTLLFIGLIVWGVAAFGIWAIANVIKNNKNLFKL